MLSNPQWNDVQRIMGNKEQVNADAGEAIKFSRDRMNHDQQLGTQLELLQRAIANMNEKGIVAKGADLGTRTEMVTRYNAMANIFGLPQVEAKAAGAAEQALSLSSQIGVAGIGKMGGRAARIFGTILQQAPSPERPEAAPMLIAGLKEAVHYDHDYHTAMTSWLSNSGGSLKGFDDWFEQTHPDAMYVARAQIQGNPQIGVKSIQWLRAHPDQVDKWEAESRAPQLGHYLLGKQ